MKTTDNFYQKHRLYLKSLDEMVFVNKCVDDSYYVAKSLLNKMSESAFVLKGDALKLISKWFFDGSTLELKEALQFTNYDSDNLTHFNAMCLLDNLSIYVKEK